MFDFLVGLLEMPRAAWMGMVIGGAFAYLAWNYLPTSESERASIGALLLIGGFLVGLAWATFSKNLKNK
jgi:hypothetical protein